MLFIQKFLFITKIECYEVNLFSFWYCSILAHTVRNFLKPVRNFLINLNPYILMKGFFPAVKGLAIVWNLQEWIVHQWSGIPGFNPRSSHTKDSKDGTWCLLSYHYYFRCYKVRIKAKCNNPGNEVAPSPSAWFNSYWKGSLRVALDYGWQTTVRD